MDVGRPQIGPDDLRIADHFLRAALGNLLAVIQHDHAVGHGHDRAHHVLDDDDRQPARGELSEQRHGLIDLRRIESGHDLVEQQQLGLRRQSPRHLQPSLIDRREIARRGLFASAEPHEFDRLACLVAGSRERLVVQECTGHDVRQHGHTAERLGDLERSRHSARADLVGAQPGDLPPECHHRPGVRPLEPGDQVEARRLAGAVRAQQRHGLVLGDREAHILHRAQPAETLAEVFDDENVSHGSHSAGWPPWIGTGAAGPR